MEKGPKRHSENQKLFMNIMNTNKVLKNTTDKIKEILLPEMENFSEAPRVDGAFYPLLSNNVMKDNPFDANSALVHCLFFGLECR